MKIEMLTKRADMRTRFPQERKFYEKGKTYAIPGGMPLSLAQAFEACGAGVIIKKEKAVLFSPENKAKAAAPENKAKGKKAKGKKK